MDETIKTDLELEHVTGMIQNLDTEVVDVWRVLTTTSSVLHVPSDISCDARISFFHCCNGVTVVVGIKAPRNKVNAARLNMERNGKKPGLTFRERKTICKYEHHHPQVKSFLTFQMQPRAWHLASSAFSSG